MTTRKPTTPKKPAPKKKPNTAKATQTASELARLDSFAFRRAMLEQVLADRELARQGERHTAVMELTRQAIRLQAEIAEHELAERASSTKLKSADELLAGLVQAVAALPDGAFERLAAAVDQRRTGRPRMRVVGPG